MFGKESAVELQNLTSFLLNLDPGRDKDQSMLVEEKIIFHLSFFYFVYRQDRFPVLKGYRTLACKKLFLKTLQLHEICVNYITLLLDTDPNPDPDPGEDEDP
jgi:hypothetical protein